MFETIYRNLKLRKIIHYKRKCLAMPHEKRLAYLGKLSVAEQSELYQMVLAGKIPADRAKGCMGCPNLMVRGSTKTEIAK